VVVSAGQVSDGTQVDPLLEDAPTANVLADKGYDSDHVLEKIEDLGVSVVIPLIPPKSTRKLQRAYDRELYKERNRIERTFGKLKSFRRIATRYDRKALYYKSFVYLAASLMWL